MDNEKKQPEANTMTHDLDKILPAIMMVQSSIDPIKKDVKNEFFKSNYADLAAIWNGIRKVMLENGLMVTHRLFDDESGKHWINTRVYHAVSGQFLESTCPINPTKNDAQGYGSAVTYMRRYSLSALLGIVTDDDDDGNAASQNVVKPAQKKQEPIIKPVTLEEFTMMKEGIEAAMTFEELQSAFSNVTAAQKRLSKQDLDELIKLKDVRKSDINLLNDSLPY